MKWKGRWKFALALVAAVAGGAEQWGAEAASSKGAEPSSTSSNIHAKSEDTSTATKGGDGQNTITPPKWPRRRRFRRSSVSREALHDYFESLKSSVAIGTPEEVQQGLKKLEQMVQLCDVNLDDLGDMEDSEENVADQLASLIGLSEISDDFDLDDRDDSSQSDLEPDAEKQDSSSDKTGSVKKKRWKYKTSCADKQENVKLKRLVKKLKDHQAAEYAKLIAVKKKVESLVNSLHGTRANLLEAKKESIDMGKELDRIHKQAFAAAQLDKEIAEIQEHARINYETGQVELSLGTGETSQLSLDEVAAKVQLANLEKNKGRLYNSDESMTMHGHHDMADDILSNLADPAVLHADLRLLIDIVLLLGSATIGGMMAAVAYMPPIIGYIAGGVIVGPSGLDLVQTVVEVDTLAQFGSVFFLFAHGLEYSFSEQRQFQTVAVGGCLLSTAICAVSIQIYALASGIVQSPLEGGLLGLSSSLSSLSLVLDYLHEQRLLHTVHGKVMVGFLTFQGLMMGLLFSLPPAISGGVVSVGGVGFALFRSLSGIVLVASFAYSFSRYLMPTLLEFLTKNRANYDELYLLGIVSLAMVMALLTEFLGLSLDLGAFFAGLMLAGTPFMKRTSAAIQPLASVFAAMLFASIGMIINPSFFWTNFGVIMVVVIQIVLIKVIVVTTVVRLFSYSWKISIISGIGLAHVGEFSLLFSSKLQAHLLLSRRAYLVFLAATVTTIVLAPLVLRMMHYMIPKIMKLLNIPSVETEDDYRAHYQLRQPRSNQKNGSGY